MAHSYKISRCMEEIFDGENFRRLENFIEEKFNPVKRYLTTGVAPKEMKPIEKFYLEERILLDGSIITKAHCKISEYVEAYESGPFRIIKVKLDNLISHEDNEIIIAKDTFYDHYNDSLSTYKFIHTIVINDDLYDNGDMTLFRSICYAIAHDIIRSRILYCVDDAEYFIDMNNTTSIIFNITRSVATLMLFKRMFGFNISDVDIICMKYQKLLDATNILKTFKKYINEEPKDSRELFNSDEYNDLVYAVAMDMIKPDSFGVSE